MSYYTMSLRVSIMISTPSPSQSLTYRADRLISPDRLKYTLLIYIFIDSGETNDGSDERYHPISAAPQMDPGTPPL